MSSFSDTLKGIRDLLLLQRDVRDLERAVDTQRDELEDHADQIIDLDKRLYAMERIMELGLKQTQQKRIEE